MHYGKKTKDRAIIFFQTMLVLGKYYLILQIPNTISVCKLFKCSAAFWQYATLKTTHVEQQVRVVLAID